MRASLLVCMNFDNTGTRALIVILFLISGSNLALAQRSFGYVFAGGTFSRDMYTFHSDIGAPFHSGIGRAFRFGVGGEGRVAPRVTLGGEIGFAGGNRQVGVLGILGSANASFHLGSTLRQSRIDPFVTGGATAARGAGESAAFLNFSGGLHYWFRPHVGLRTEFRGYPSLDENRSGFCDFRMGIVFGK